MVHLDRLERNDPAVVSILAKRAAVFPEVPPDVDHTVDAQSREENAQMGAQRARPLVLHDVVSEPANEASRQPLRVHVSVLSFTGSRRASCRASSAPDASPWSEPS